MRSCLEHLVSFLRIAFLTPPPPRTYKVRVDVAYDDGDTEDCVHSSAVRPPTKALLEAWALSERKGDWRQVRPSYTRSAGWDLGVRGADVRA